MGVRWWQGVVAVAAAGMAVLVGTGRAAAGPAQASPDAVERVVRDFAGRAGYPGIAVAITDGEDVLYAGGYGHDSSGAPVTATTPMPIASVSKSFTALAVMRLVEAGKVELDAPVTRYLPDFRIDDTRGSQITVRELLSQTSGITDMTLREKSLPQPGSLAGAQQRAQRATLATDPGTTFRYTNTNYHLVARLVEVVSGQPFADHLRDRVFVPLGMQSTVSITRTTDPRLLDGYTYAYGATVAAAEPERFVAGSDGVITTATDMANWLIMQNGNHPGLVSAANLTAMHTPAEGSTYALGWERDHDGRLHHNGVWFTYTASQLLLPSGYGIAVLGNSGIGLGNEGTDQLADALAELVTGGTPHKPAPVRLIVDLSLAGLTLLSVALGIRNLSRSGAWARRFATKPRWQAVVRLTPRLIPAVLLATLPDLLGQVVGGGRDITFVQLVYYTFPLVAWTTVAAVANLCVLVTRASALTRARHTDVPADFAQAAAAEPVPS